MSFWRVIDLLHVHFSDCEVFPKNHAAPFSKVLTFYRKEPFSLEAYYNCPKDLPFPDPTIGKDRCMNISQFTTKATTGTMNNVLFFTLLRPVCDPEGGPSGHR